MLRPAYLAAIAEGSEQIASELHDYIVSHCGADDGAHRQRRKISADFGGLLADPDLAGCWGVAGEYNGGAFSVHREANTRDSFGNGRGGSESAGSG